MRQLPAMPWFETILQDIRYALRGFRGAPVFTLAAAVAIALGIGASTAVFSVVSGVLLQPLPYSDAAGFVGGIGRIPVFHGLVPSGTSLAPAGISANRPRTASGAICWLYRS